MFRKKILKGKEGIEVLHSVAGTNYTHYCGVCLSDQLHEY
jgi:hypothetical protein